MRTVFQASTSVRALRAAHTVFPQHSRGMTGEFRRLRDVLGSGAEVIASGGNKYTLVDVLFFQWREAQRMRVCH